MSGYQIEHLILSLGPHLTLQFLCLTHNFLQPPGDHISSFLSSVHCVSVCAFTLLVGTVRFPLLVLLLKNFKRRLLSCWMLCSVFVFSCLFQYLCHSNVRYLYTNIKFMKTKQTAYAIVFRLVSWEENLNPVSYGRLMALVNNLTLTKKKARKQTPTLTSQTLNREGPVIVDLNRRIMFHQNGQQEAQGGKTL